MLYIYMLHSYLLHQIAMHWMTTENYCQCSTIQQPQSKKPLHKQDLRLAPKTICNVQAHSIQNPHLVQQAVSLCRSHQWLYTGVLCMSVGSCRAAAVQCQHGSPCKVVPYISPALEYTTGSNTGGLQVNTHYRACLQQSQMNVTSNRVQPSVHSKENKILLAFNNQAAL